MRLQLAALLRIPALVTALLALGILGSGGGTALASQDSTATASLERRLLTPAGPASDSIAPPLRADPDFFFADRALGSDAAVGPIHLILNRAFQTAQANNRDRGIFDYSYAWSHVGNSLRRPVYEIRRSGFERIASEFYPTGLDIDGWDWWANYFGHVLEGGIATRQLSEWYHARGVPAPKIMGALTSWAAAALNEAYEHPGIETGWASTALDLYFFDPLGMVLFSHDGVARFFSKELRGTVWPRQPAVTLPDADLHNNGQDLVLKLPLPTAKSTRLFFRTGLGHHMGVTFERSDGLDLSLGFGGEAGFQRLELEARSEAVEQIALSAAVFLDRNNALLGSLFLTNASDRYVTLNVYPGVFGSAPRLGAFLIVGTSTAQFGVSLAGTGLPGGGIALR